MMLRGYNSLKNAYKIPYKTNLRDIVAVVVEIIVDDD